MPPNLPIYNIKKNTIKITSYENQHLSTTVPRGTQTTVLYHNKIYHTTNKFKVEWWPTFVPTIQDVPHPFRRSHPKKSHFFYMTSEQTRGDGVVVRLTGNIIFSDGDICPISGSKT